MANGIAGLPFPTFGGEKSPGVTPVKLQPSQVRFPTPRLSSRTPEPDFKEAIAGLLPFATEGVLGLIRGDGAPLTMDDRQEYIDENILYGDKSGAPLTNVQQAKLDAYDIYGPPDDGSTDWGSIIANLAVGSQMGRGAGNYATTAVALNKARKTKEAATETARATFLKERTKTDDKDIILTDLNAARLGQPQYRRAKYSEVGGKGTYKLHDPRGDFGKPDSEGYVVAPEGWVDPSQMGPNWQVSSVKDPTLISLSKTIEEGMSKDQAQSSAITVVNAQLKLLRKDINDSGVTYTTLTSDLMNMGNNAFVEARAFLDFLGNGDYRTGFNDGTGQGIRFDGDGTASLNAFEALSVPLDQYSDDQLETILSRLERTADIDGNKSWIKDALGDTAYGNVRVRANFLQLAYMAAAASGQTGRTLSDKDLAFFLEIVGGKGTSDPTILHDNLLEFMDQQIAAGDSSMLVKLGKNSLPQYNLVDESNTAARNLVGMYYNVGQTADGREDWANKFNYRYKNYYDRYYDNPEVVKFYGISPVNPDRYQRPWNAQGQSTTRRRPGINTDEDWFGDLPKD